MNNNMYEFSVPPVNEKFQKMCYNLISVFMVIDIILGVLAFFMGLYFIDLFILAIMLAVIAVVLFFVRKKFYNFYDYIFIDGSIRIIRVVNNVKRKKVLVFDVKDIKSIGMLGGSTHEKFNTNKEVKKLYGMGKGELLEGDYVFNVYIDGTNYLLFLRQNETFLRYIVKMIGITKFDKDFIEKIKKSENK